MKRIFSKKSGFTLVEIVVAFAVFAIMAAMILSMVKLTVEAQSENNAFSDSLEEQTNYLAYHYIGDEDKYDTTDGTFELKFYDEDNKSVCDVSMDYSTRSSVLLDEEGNANTNDGEGVNYFVGNVDYADASSIQNNDGQNQGDNISGLGNSQAARYDTRLTGSKNLDYITIWKVVKDDTYSGSGARYLFEVSANGNSLTGISEEDLPYLQYKLRFCMDTYTEVEGVGSDGKTYMYKIYDDAIITDCGYIEDFSSALAWSDSYCYNYRRTTMIAKNKYTVQPTGKNTVRIGVPAGSTDGFGYATTTRFYVVFKEDPKLDLYSFGENYTLHDGKPEYTVYPIKDDDGNETGEHNPNIYGAFTYEKTLKAGS